MIVAITLAMAAQASVGATSQATPLSPNGSTGAWVTNDDYPKIAQLANIQGVVSFRLYINQLGQPEQCDITDTSGSAILDAETCRLLKLRARFIPAKDHSGRPTVGTYSGRFRWQIAQNAARQLPIVGSVGAALNETLRIVVDDKGKVVECELISPNADPADGTALCEQVSSKPVTPFIDEAGQPVRKTIIIRREVEFRDE